MIHAAAGKGNTNLIPGQNPLYTNDTCCRMLFNTNLSPRQNRCYTIVTPLLMLIYSSLELVKVDILEFK